MRSDVRRFLLPSLASLIAVTLAFACGTQEVSIPDPIRPDGAAATDSATDGALDAPVADGALDVPADVVCPEVLPEDATGVYVAPTGVNDVACGTRAAPCKTLSVGITHAVAASRPKVHVARGTYVERVALAAGVELIGGWDVTAGTTKWKRACVTPEEIVVVRAPAAQNTTVEAIDLGGEARLSLLRIDSKPAAQVAPGESLYGVVAVGATTTLVMTDVRVDVNAAGAGASAPKGATGVAGGASCPAGTGLAGTPGGQGAGASFGEFDISGYQPDVAASGTLGGAGTNGTTGATGSCVVCGTCDLFPLCNFIPGPKSCGKDGTSGCGGGPGVPGGPATGGGSSVGVYAWDATVTINGGKIKSGDAGNGGGGGAGGNGGAATAGAVGTPALDCVTSCAAGAAACIETMTRGLGGAAGGTGGLGGAGGSGGGGGGGSSFATYQGNVGIVSTTPSTNLAHGKAGAGGGAGAGAGAPGAAADHVP